MTRRDYLILQYLIENRVPAARLTDAIRSAVFKGSGRCQRRLSMLKERGYVTSDPTGRGVGSFGAYRPGPHVWDVTLEGVNAYRTNEGQKPISAPWEEHYHTP